ncbi:hypothetical protein GCM10023231_38910 [Olivibacter ginsenosidimutans]|uniref:Thioredoxin-like fold domain-containing protein n=1 Tax=Olivibacter ginsenosidimutans TaxID=1176537 RepID=A0ABP9C6T2_9SPHI
MIQEIDIKTWIITLTSLITMITTAKGQDILPKISLAQLDDSMLVKPQPIVVLIGSGRCGYCAMQRKLLEKDKQIALLFKSVYFVELNAEEDSPVYFNKRLYQPPLKGVSGGIHDLAVTLSGNQNQMSFPLWILLDANYRVLYRYNGLLRKNQLMSLLSLDVPEN